MSKRALWLLVAGCLFAAAMGAADDPFVGEWTLNPAKSRLPDEMKVESVGANKYAFDFGGTAETIVIDGTDQPGVFGTTLSVTAVAPDNWKVVRKKEGKTIVLATWKLSQDGNSLTDDFTYFDPKGSANNMVYVYKRTAGKAGFAATWESTSEQINFVITLQVRPYEGDGLSFVNSMEGVTKKVKFDGKDYPNEGANAQPGAMSSGRRVNERTLELTDKTSGKMTATEQIELSPDHKALTMTVLPAGKSKPNILVFDRQYQ